MSAASRAAVLGALVALAGSGLAAQGDGAPDPGWGEQGVVLRSLGYLGSGRIEVADLAGDDDRLYAAGRWSPTASSDYHLDWAAFGLDGVRDDALGCTLATGSLFPFGATSRARAAIVDATGGLVVGGALAFDFSADQDRALLARFDLDAGGCTLDPSFSGSGWEVFDDEPFCDTEDCAVEALAEIRPETGALPAPRLIALVRASVNLLARRYFLVGLTVGGDLDPGFGAGGWREIAPPSLGTLVGATLAVDGRGRPLVAVTRIDPGAADDLDVWLVRYTAAGALDPTMGTGGLWSVHETGSGDPYDAIVHDLLVDADGRPIVALEVGDDAHTVVVDLAELENHSTVWANQRSPRLAAQGNRRFLRAVDDRAADGLHARRSYFPPGQPLPLLDPTFGEGGTADYDIDALPGSVEEESVERLRLWHGRPVVAGTADSLLGGTLSYLLRGANRYVFADGFDGGGAGAWTRAVVTDP